MPCAVCLPSFVLIAHVVFLLEREHTQTDAADYPIPTHRRHGDIKSISLRGQTVSSSAVINDSTMLSVPVCDLTNTPKKSTVFSACPVHCGKTADQIWMRFGTVGRMGPVMRQVVGFGDRSTGGGYFGGECGASHCNQ